MRNLLDGMLAGAIDRVACRDTRRLPTNWFRNTGIRSSRPQRKGRDVSLKSDNRYAFWLDLRIMLMTFRVMTWGQRRPEGIPSDARIGFLTSDDFASVPSSPLIQRGAGVT